jgi:hypothetical protein
MLCAGMSNNMSEGPWRSKIDGESKFVEVMERERGRQKERETEREGERERETERERERESKRDKDSLTYPNLTRTQPHLAKPSLTLRSLA